MHQSALHNEFTFDLEHLHNVLVCLLDVLSDEIWDLIREATRFVYGAWWHFVCLNNPVCDSDAVIVVTEGWCLVNNTSTAIGGYVCVVQNLESSVAELPQDRKSTYVEHDT